MTKRKPETWTFAIYYMRDKSQTLRLLSSLAGWAADNLLGAIREDKPCIGCVGLFDLEDRTTPHAVVFAVHSRGEQWTGLLCKACVDDYGGNVPNNRPLMNFVTTAFKEHSGADMKLSTLKMREKETADAVAGVLEKIKGKRPR